MPDKLTYLKNYLKKAEVNANGILNDLNEPDKVFIEASEIIEMIKGIKREIQYLGYDV